MRLPKHVVRIGPSRWKPHVKLSGIVLEDRFTKNRIQIGMIVDNFRYAGFQTIKYIIRFCPADNFIVG